MFHDSSKLIVFLTRGAAHIATVRLHPKPTVVHTKRVSWNALTLPGLFQQIKIKYNTSSLRVLLGDELSYIVTLTIPPLPLSTERSYIQKQLTSVIPETLGFNDWDYKVASVTKQQKTVLVFTPVQSVLNVITKSALQSAMTVEAIEPQSIAAKRNVNPLIGLAMKKDIKGADEEVLNVTPFLHKTDTVSPKQPFHWKLFLSLTIGVTSLVLTGSTVALLMYMHNTPPSVIQEEVKEQTTPPLEPTQEEELTPEPTQEEEPDLSEISVLILNGTGIPGSSKAIKDLLEENGFMKVDAGNADSFGFTKTEVSLHSSLSPRIYEIIASLLSNYDVVQKDPLTSDFNYDVLITVGTKQE